MFADAESSIKWNILAPPSTVAAAADSFVYHLHALLMHTVTVHLPIYNYLANDR